MLHRMWSTSTHMRGSRTHPCAPNVTTPQLLLMHVSCHERCIHLSCESKPSVNVSSALRYIDHDNGLN
eukprot:m.1140380 g.1140380  ORF g.1140380 m.1140380 type:complete len:68 (+) comp24445_c0_seq5:3146-3349(+)